MAQGRHIFQVYVGAFSNFYEALSIEASKKTTSIDIVTCVIEKLGILASENYELAEVVLDSSGQVCKERRLCNEEYPVSLQMLWPRQELNSKHPLFRFCLREKKPDISKPPWSQNSEHPAYDYYIRFLYQPKDKEYTDLCQLPTLTEDTLLSNLKARFHKGHIYTYVGSILIAVNPFTIYPIYNPKYVKLYQNGQLGDLPPHIFAIADATYQLMLRNHRNQCIVISGESGSGKTESTHLLLHHLTSLSHKSSHDNGVEQTILSASPVLEAFGNAKTKHNNNSSRFGKFIQVNYKENGQVHGALVQKYLLEKSRIVSHAKNERNYHVFYYLLMGASNEEKELFHLSHPRNYHYLNQSQCYSVEGMDDTYEFLRLKQSMEMVGFSPEKQKRVFGVLAAVLHLGNVEFIKKSSYHSDEAVDIKNQDVVNTISKLLGVKDHTLMAALTCKHAKAKEETLVFNYKFPEAIATRDALAKCLYGALFDWIVMQVNQALLAKQETRQHIGNSIDVLDIFGFEDFTDHNSFEQFCINFANEHLQYYFNQHVFKYEQEEYQREGIQWNNIEFTDNTGCLELIEARPHGLLCLLDDQCSFPGATDATLLQKFENHHKNKKFYELPHCRESAFYIQHYAGKVKYNIKDFREKNLDLMRPDVVMLLKSSNLTLVRELVGGDPVASFRWSILRAFFRAYSVFNRIRKSPKSAHIKANFKNLNCTSPLVRSPSQPKNSGLPPGLETVLCPSEAKVLQQANQILMKNGQHKTKFHKKEKSLNNLQTVKKLIGKSNYKPAKKQHPTVGTQFQVSLNQLMDALNQANPFFVRCIKSNSEKIPNNFDEAIILQQLRYTGMLETVRIRQSGYSVRLTFEEFIQRYRILLPKGLLSSRADIQDFISTKLEKENYQMGKTKVFLREAEKLKLDEILHQTIVNHIVYLQSRIKAWHTRRNFVKLKTVTILLQRRARELLKNRRRSQLCIQVTAAILIQSYWRGYIARKRYHSLRRHVVSLQAYSRGYLARKRFTKTWTKQQNRVIHEPLRKCLSHESANGVKLHRKTSRPSRSYHFPKESIEPLGSLEGSGVLDPALESLFIKRSQSSDNVPKCATTSPNKTTPKEEALSLSEVKIEEEAGSKSRFRRAKKHLRTFISNKKDSEESGPEDFSGTGFLDEVQARVLPDHQPRLATSFHRSDFCSICGKTMFHLFIHGYVCSECKLNFHIKCLRHAAHMSCIPSSTLHRPPKSKTNSLPSWNVTRTAEFQDPKDIIITDVSELENMDAFIFKKMCQMSEKNGSKDSTVDVIFKKALKAFKSNLISTFSVAAQDGILCIRYKDLIDHFEQVIRTVVIKEKTSRTFPVIVGVNAFRGFLDEFRNLYRNDDKPKTKQKKRKKRKNSGLSIKRHMEHQFVITVINIPTMCEICTSYIWLMEKGYVCQSCKLTCHKKCVTRIQANCSNEPLELGRRVYGAPLQYLVSEEIRIPVVMERLITAIELKGLYTEGLYRKSGISSRVKRLKELLEEEFELVELDTYPVHVLTTALKSFFREMPEPLMTFDLYDSFIRTSELADEEERCSTIYNLLHQLPQEHYDVLERLMFHLARVAQQEESNRMTTNALAIVFAPCILRTKRETRIQDTLEDIAKQTTCVEIILTRQLQRVLTTLEDIATLDIACHTASSRLTSLRSSKMLQERSPDPRGEEEDLLTSHIVDLQNEKVLLTTALPTLSSDEDLLSTDSVMGSVDDLPNSYPKASTQQHLTKHRAANPRRRTPSCSNSPNKILDDSVVSGFPFSANDHQDAIIV